MHDFGIPASVIASLISVCTMIFMVGFIRRLANGVIVIVFSLAAILPFASGFYDVGVPNTYLYIYSFALGLAAVLVTTPLWGVSTIMMKSSVSNENKIAELEKKIDLLQKQIMPE